MKVNEEKESINMISSFEEPDELTLDPKHPGVNDPDYIARRTMFFETARQYRLQEAGVPEIPYTEDEQNIWCHVSKALLDAHEKHACSIYLEGKKALNLETDRIPNFKELNQSLKLEHGFQLIPAEGLIDTRNFFHYLSLRGMPCTQFLRHGSHPEYTPEPDAVHDVIGHLPPLMNQEYVELIQLIGSGVKTANEKQLLAWQHIYWFTIEFGLIEEAGTLKAFGAGLLSSSGELAYCFSDKVDRRALNIDEIINTQYDTTKMQDILFVIPSFRVLREEIEKLMLRFEDE